MPDVPPAAPLARRNALLDTLDDTTLAALLPHLTDVPLRLGAVAYEVGEAVEAVYFPLVGMVSIVAQLDGDEVVEVASAGREGMVGLPAFLGARVATERALVQVEGRALRMDVGDFTREIERLDGALSAPLHRYTQAMFTQLARNGACNRVHNVRQRASRWLLTVADRMDGPTFQLKQEFLAQMLAVRRSSVSQVAKALADDGCITYVRGNLTVLDRDRLHGYACECYDIIRTTMIAAKAAPAAP